MRIKAIQRKAFEEPSINLTPLIDVVFVILIMFIVVAPLLELDRVELADASHQSNDQTVSLQNESPITIHVHRNNQVLLNGQALSVDRLSHELKILKQRYPKNCPQVFHDKRAEFGTYQSVKNAVESAGFQQMDIILKP